jgi:hypothetical protein
MSNDQSSEEQRQAQAARRAEYEKLEQCRTEEARRAEQERQAQARAVFESQRWLRGQSQRTRDYHRDNNGFSY